MTKKQEQQMNDYYTELLNNGSIKTINEAFIFILSYEKAFSLNGVGSSNKGKYKKAFNLAMKYIGITGVSLSEFIEKDCALNELKQFIKKHKLM